MINKRLVDSLHAEHIINKDYVLWWQLGFEGRSIYNEREFSEGLREIKFQVLKPELMYANVPNSQIKKGDYLEKTVNVWAREEVPILLREIKLGEYQIPIFATVKPLSHRDGEGDGWNSLRKAINEKSQFFLSQNLFPHIRGIVIDATKEFLFFYPFLFGKEDNSYKTKLLNLRGCELPIFVDPISPKKFYQKGIDRNWSGRRCQRKPELLNLEEENLHLVPYFEFDASKNKITVYPLEIERGNLVELTEEWIKKGYKKEVAEEFVRKHSRTKIIEAKNVPTLLRGEGNGKVSVLGAGIVSSDNVYYWKFDKKRGDVARTSLKDRLDLRA
jgi:hypothetical protein